MTRSQLSRTSAALAATAILTATVPLLTATAASATTAGDCQSASVQYRVVDTNGNPVGADWSSQGWWTTAPGTVQVRLAPGQTVGQGCSYPVSLAEYTTEGPSWNTSGHQTLVDHATVYLTAADLADANGGKQTWQKLSVKAPDCYGQIDLYGDDTVYDGKSEPGHGPLPYQPGNVVTPYHLITAWNGGDKPCTPDKPGSSAPTPPKSTTATPSTPPKHNKTTPPATHTKTPKGSTPPTTSHVPPLKSKPPTTPTPSPSHSAPPLAETGSSVPVGLMAGGAAVAIALGAGAVYATRRTRRS